MNISSKGPDAIPQRKAFAMGQHPTQGKRCVNTNTPQTTTGAVRIPSARS